MREIPRIDVSEPVAAFIPQQVADQGLDDLQKGVQLRDYFAAKVMAQIQSQYAKGHSDGWDGMAAMAYSYADAMIRVRSKTIRGLKSCN